MLIFQETFCVHNQQEKVEPKIFFTCLCLPQTNSCCSPVSTGKNNSTCSALSYLCFFFDKGKRALQRISDSFPLGERDLRFESERPYRLVSSNPRYTTIPGDSTPFGLFSLQYRPAYKTEAYLPKKSKKKEKPQS